MKNVGTQNEMPYKDEVNAMLKRIEGTFKKHFPYGFINSVICESSSDDTYIITIKIGLVGDKADLFFGYRENDPMDILIMIHPSNYNSIKSKEDNFKPELNYVVKSLKGSVIYVKPAPDSYLAFDMVKIPFRKVTNSILKLEKTIIKHIENMAKAVKSVPYSKISFEGREIPEKYYKTVKV